MSDHQRQNGSSQERRDLSRANKKLESVIRVARNSYEQVSKSAVTNVILENITVVLLVFTVVVVALAVWIGYDAVALGSSTGWPDFALVGLANALLVGIAVASGAYCTYLCVKYGRASEVMGLGFLGSLAAPVLFMVSCVLMLIAFFFFFHRGDVRVGFYLMLAALVPAVLLMLAAWKCSSKSGYSALWASLPFVIVLGLITWLFWRTHDYVGSSVYGTE